MDRWSEETLGQMGKIESRIEKIGEQCRWRLKFLQNLNPEEEYE